jgi:hypothetical protein
VARAVVCENAGAYDANGVALGILASGAAAGGDLGGTYPNPTLAAIGAATGPVGDTTHSPSVTIDAKGRVTALTSNAIAFPAVPVSSVYGDGSDGTRTYDGTTTILGVVPSPNSAVNGVYTLTRDIFLAAGTLNSGITIITNGFRIFCSGTFTNNGTIQWNGKPGSGATAGAAVSNTAGTLQHGAAAAAPGTAGGNGGTAAGSAGTSNTNQGFGASGGVGGTGTSGGGGAAGTATAQTAAFSPPRSLLAALGATAWSDTGWVRSAGGSGGGGGGGDTTNSGGGGGGGGGIVALYIQTLAGTGVVQARGGNGVTPALGNTGGGGGGGGGYIVVVSGSVSGGAISGQTIDANGGTKGSPHGTGTDNAANGSNGNVYLIPN